MHLCGNDTLVCADSVVVISDFRTTIKSGSIVLLICVTMLSYFSSYQDGMLDGLLWVLFFSN
jgi:hypothetical protein